jgi:hypothetical protein
VSSADPQATEIEDYASVLSEMPTIVAGQAVNIWAKIYERRTDAGLEVFRPFTSKDLDLAGDSKLLDRIRMLSGGRTLYAGPRSAVVGSVELMIRSEVRKVEVLRDVKGLAPRDLEDVIEVGLPAMGLRVRVLSPTKVLKAKLCNSAEIDQENRNDVRHVRIMISCVREFLRDALTSAQAGQTSERDAVNLFEEVLELARSTVARRAAEKWGFDLSSVWPPELFASGLSKIANFVRHRLSPPAN